MAIYSSGSSSESMHMGRLNERDGGICERAGVHVADRLWRAVTACWCRKMDRGRLTTLHGR